MFQVKATLVGFLGDEEKYPCHFGHKIGDEFTYDGEKFHGRICPHALPVVMPQLWSLIDAGPRYVQPAYYVPFWYVPETVRDASMKPYDGVGWKVRKEPAPEAPHSLGALIPKGGFNYPTLTERTVCKDVTVVCPDARTSAVFRLEAFDLGESGDNIPYFRLQMILLSVARNNPGILLDDMRDKLSPPRREEIYPLAAPVLVRALVEELESLGYVEVRDDQVFITESGERKLKDFLARLPEEDRKALEPDLV
jgi:uncharacterized repeat protein (TIGR04076 family)